MKWGVVWKTKLTRIHSSNTRFLMPSGLERNKWFGIFPIARQSTWEGWVLRPNHFFTGLRHASGITSRIRREFSRKFTISVSREPAESLRSWIEKILSCSMSSPFTMVCLSTVLFLIRKSIKMMQKETVARWGNRFYFFNNINL